MDLTDVYLDSLLVFVLSLLVLALSSLSWTYAFIPFGIFLVYHTYYTITGFSFEQVEQKVPELKEALRTVVDHLDKQNDVISQLFEDVLAQLKKVRTSYFVEFGAVSKQIILLSILCFAVVTISSLNVHFADINGVLSQGALFGDYELEGNLLLDKGNDTDIYGDESVAKAGTEDLPIELTQISNEADLNKPKPIDNDGRFENMYPGEVGAVVTDNYADQIPKKYQDIVKNYFKGIPH